MEAGSDIRIPVSCVERGRWDRGGEIMPSDGGSRQGYGHSRMAGLSRRGPWMNAAYKACGIFAILGRLYIAKNAFL